MIRINKFLNNFANDDRKENVEQVVRQSGDGVLRAYIQDSVPESAAPYYFFGNLADGVLRVTDELRALLGFSDSELDNIFTAMVNRISNEHDRECYIEEYEALRKGKEKGTIYFRVNVPSGRVWLCQRVARVLKDQSADPYICGSFEIFDQRRIVKEMLLFSENGSLTAGIVDMLEDAPPLSPFAVITPEAVGSDRAADFAGLLAKRLSESSTLFDRTQHFSNGIAAAMVSPVFGHLDVTALRECVSAEISRVLKGLGMADAVRFRTDIVPGSDDPVVSRKRRFDALSDLAAAASRKTAACAAGRLLCVSEALAIAQACLNDFSGFNLYLQLKTRADTLDFEGGEFLIRMKSGDGPGPGRFIPFLEQSALAAPLGRWTVEKAAELSAAHLPVGDGFHVSVNVSPRQMLDPSFFDFLETVWRRYLPLGTLTLELTETAAMPSAEALDIFTEGCRRLGARASLDDCGNGYNGLETAVRHHFDEVKFSRSFTLTLLGMPHGAEFFARLIGAVRLITDRICIEGIEDAATLEAVRPLGADCYQGYHFAKPLPVEVAAKLLRHRKPA
ncbi:MAG: EAL domain-containing protein [Sutterella sp.]|nr:EAL domain-containing protein [Sutterella sp.]